MTTNTTSMTTQEVADRFMELAREEKWFAIQDELFAEDVRSIEPPHSLWFKSAEGKANVRKKGEAFVADIEAAHKRFTSEPIVASGHFVVVRESDITKTSTGRIHIHELMLYEVRDGKIVSEQFFY